MLAYVYYRSKAECVSKSPANHTKSSETWTSTLLVAQETSQVSSFLFLPSVRSVLLADVPAPTP